MAHSKTNQLFNLYVKNYRDTMNFGLDEPIVEKELFACPICLREFTRADLQAKRITLEHIPPKSLGGKPRTLTCKQCNETFSPFDNNLAVWHQSRHFLNNEAGGRIQGKVRLTDRTSFPGILIRSEEQPSLRVSIKSAIDLDPVHALRINEIFKAGLPQPMEFISTFPEEQALYISFLKIAYLWTFSIFGYGYLRTSGAELVRQQITQPNKNLIPVWRIFEPRPNAADGIQLGLSLISTPIEMASFAVKFELSSTDSTSTYLVILPGVGEGNKVRLSPTGRGRGVRSWVWTHTTGPKHDLH